MKNKNKLNLKLQGPLVALDSSYLQKRGSPRTYCVGLISISLGLGKPREGGSFYCLSYVRGGGQLGPCKRGYGLLIRGWDIEGGVFFSGLRSWYKLGLVPWVEPNPQAVIAFGIIRSPINPESQYKSITGLYSNYYCFICCGCSL